MDDLVQPIAVARSGSHEDLIAAVASASLDAYLDHGDDPAWDQWLNGRFTKSVRRATASQLAAVAPLALAVVQRGDAVAYGFAPMPYSEYPGPIRKMQVQGTERPRSGNWADFGSPSLVLNGGLEMSTGKAAAQAAHGLWIWWLTATITERQEWEASGRPLSVCEYDSEAFRRTLQITDVVVRDAGLTEVEPGTVTVAVISDSTCERL